MLDAQGPVGTFTGAISLGFCPQTELRRPFCASDDLRYVGGAVQPPKPGRKSSLPKQPGVLAPSARLSAPWSWIDAGDSAKTCSASIDPAFPAPPDARRIVSAPGNRDRLYLQQYDALAAKLSAQARPAPPADRKSTRLNSSHSSASRMHTSACKQNTKHSNRKGH